MSSIVCNQAKEALTKTTIPLISHSKIPISISQIECKSTPQDQLPMKPDNLSKNSQQHKGRCTQTCSASMKRQRRNTKKCRLNINRRRICLRTVKDSQTNYVRLCQRRNKLNWQRKRGQKNGLYRQRRVSINDLNCIFEPIYHNTNRQIKMIVQMNNHFSAAGVWLNCSLDSLAVHTDNLSVLASINAEGNATEHTCEKEETETPHPSYSSWHFFREIVSISSTKDAHSLIHRQSIREHRVRLIHWYWDLIVLSIDRMIVRVVITWDTRLRIDVLLIVLRWRWRLLIVVVEQGLLANTVIGHATSLYQIMIICQNYDRVNEINGILNA